MSEIQSIEYVSYNGEKFEVKDFKLELSDKAIKDITDIEGLENLIKLKSLDLSKNQITEIIGLENLVNLKSLNFNNNQISEIKGLENLTDLSWIDLGRNQITEIKGLENLTKLRYLDLGGNKITEIKGLENPTDLTRLYLGGNQITEIKGLENLTKLTYLHFRGNQITEIKGLKKLTNLYELGLEVNQISVIKGLENLINLRQLYLSHNRITEIKGLENLIKLDQLWLHSNKITEVKGLEALTNLKYLMLEENRVSEDIIQKFGGFTSFGTVINPQKLVEYCRQQIKTEMSSKEPYKFRSQNFYSMKSLSNLLGVILLTPVGEAMKIAKSQVFIGTLEDSAGAWIKDIKANMKYSIIAFGHKKTKKLFKEAASGLPIAREHIIKTGIETSLDKTRGLFPPQPVNQHYYHVNAIPKTKYGNCFLIILVYRQ